MILPILNLLHSAVALQLDNLALEARTASLGVARARTEPVLLPSAAAAALRETVLGVLRRSDIEPSWNKIPASHWDRRLSSSNWYCDVLPCSGTLDYVLIICNLQIVKAAGIIGDFFRSSLDGPASKETITGPDQVLSRPPDVAQEHAGTNTRVGLVLVALVGLEEVVDSLGEPQYKVAALVARDPLLRRHPVHADLVLVERVGDIRDQPTEQVDLDPPLEPRP